MSNADKISDYFRRQYETEEGTVEENINVLFTEDVVYRVGDQTVTRDGLYATAHKIRSSPKEGRSVVASNVTEEGDSVTFHLSLHVPGMAADGSAMSLESDNVWTFNAEGKVVEAVPAQVEDVAEAFREAGVDLDG